MWENTSASWQVQIILRQLAGFGASWQVHVWENTYQLAPKEDQKFLPSKVTEIIDKVMSEKLGDKEYDPDMAKVGSVFGAGLAYDPDMAKVGGIVHEGKNCSGARGDPDMDRWLNNPFAIEQLLFKGEGRRNCPCPDMAKIKVGTTTQQYDRAKVGGTPPKVSPRDMNF